MLENLIAGLLAEMNFSELFLKRFSKVTFL